MLEKSVFRQSIEAVRGETQRFWSERDPGQVERAGRDPKHEMALVFRWYLGMSSRWANKGESDRQVDYQVWCGPAMGAFNEWTRDTFLADWQQRRASTVALNILHGAAVLTRAHQLRTRGISIAQNNIDLRPRQAAELEEYLA